MGALWIGPHFLPKDGRQGAIRDEHFCHFFPPVLGKSSIKKEAINRLKSKRLLVPLQLSFSPRPITLTAGIERGGGYIGTAVFRRSLFISPPSLAVGFASPSAASPNTQA
jgi:hypothetical protein